MIGGRKGFNELDEEDEEKVGLNAYNQDQEEDGLFNRSVKTKEKDSIDLDDILLEEAGGHESHDFSEIFIH